MQKALYSILGIGAMLVVAAVGVLPHAAAQPAEDDLPPLIDRDDLFGDPEIASAQLSPDGEFVSFRQPYMGHMNVWVKEAGDDFEDARPVTADTTRSIPSYFWTQDSERILFIQDDGGDENFRVHAVDPMGEPDEELGVPEARDLTPIDDVRAQIIDVPEATPDEILVGLNDRNPQVHDVYRLNLDTGERELVIENTENVASWQTDLDGTVRVATRQNEAGDTDIHLVNDGELSDEPFYSCSVLEECGVVRFHQDNERVYMTTNRGDDVDRSRLTLYHPESGEKEIVESDPREQVDFGSPIFNEDDELIATSYVYDDGVAYYPKDEQFERDLAFLQDELPEGDLGFGSRTDDETRQIVTVQRDVDPGSTYLYDREAQTVEHLYTSRPELESDHLAHMEAISYTARDGLEIPAFLTTPRGVEAENLPVVVVPHGGPWARDTWGYDATAQFFANRGYAVLQPNFRGSTGYGKEFLNAGNEEWGDAMQDDITDGVEHLIDEGIADPDRVGIYGGSYGGYATLAGLTFTPDLYQAGVAVVPPSNIITLLESLPPYWRPMIEMFHTRVGNPDDPEDRERMKRQSPVHSADQIDAPLMVVQGANDPRVPQEESDQIVVAARDNDVDVQYLLAEDEGHGFVNEDNRLAYIAATEEFFGEHLGGRYQEGMQDEIAEALERMRMDVDAVEMPDIAADEEVEASADLPDVDGSALESGSFSYHLDIEAQGQEMESQITRTIEADTHDGQDAWRITETADNGGMQAGTQTFWLDASTLRTLKQESTGQMDIDLTFGEDAITGTIEAMGQMLEVDESLDGPVFGSGSADSEIAFAGLPVEEGYETTYRTYDVQQQTTETIHFRVTGTETVDVRAGSFDTYVVDLEAPDAGIDGTLHLMQDGPHHIVRSETTLPPEMGSATVEMELSEME